MLRRCRGLQRTKPDSPVSLVPGSRSRLVREEWKGSQIEGPEYKQEVYWIDGNNKRKRRRKRTETGRHIIFTWICRKISPQPNDITAKFSGPSKRLRQGKTLKSIYSLIGPHHSP